MADSQIDILIIGGGLTGAALMLSLANLGLSTLLIEAKPFSSQVQADFDARTLALAPATTNILKTLNIWPLLQAEAAPINTIHVSERRSFGAVRLCGEKNAPLGHVVEMQHIGRALHQLLDHQRVIAPASLIALDSLNNIATINTVQGERTIQARLIVAADGSDSSVRRLCQLSIQKKYYRHHAITANIGLARPHQNQAYERFTKDGPIALLPMNGLRASLVWSLAPEKAHQLMMSSESEFLKTLQYTFGYRLGRLIKTGQRAVFPLQSMFMPKQVVGNIVFVGNAAHTLHPVAGQGFNLGLRDIATLAQCIANDGINPDMLQNYEKLRWYDQTVITRFTEGLINLYTSKIPGLATVRGTGLVAMNNLPWLKNILGHYAKGFAGIVPDLACGP